MATAYTYTVLFCVGVVSRGGDDSWKQCCNLLQELWLARPVSQSSLHQWCSSKFWTACRENEGDDTLWRKSVVLLAAGERMLKATTQLKKGRCKIFHYCLGMYMPNAIKNISFVCSCLFWSMAWLIIVLDCVFPQDKDYDIHIFYL